LYTSVYSVLEGEVPPTPVTKDFCPNPEKEKFMARNLFVWAILFNRQEMAEVFWKRGREPMGEMISQFSYT
jgi:hypothetical protein